MLVGLVAGVVFHYQHKRDLERRVLTTRKEVDRFQSQIMLQAAMEKVPLTPRGYPVTVDPGWFGSDLPRNFLLGEMDWAGSFEDERHAQLREQFGI